VIGFGAEVAEARLTRVDNGAHGAASYEYAAAGERRWFFFAAGERAWRSGEWASDAAALCFHTAPGGIRELILTEGSYVEYAGKRAIEAREPRPRVECRADGMRWTIASPGGISLNPEMLP
jgi:hypothetical protein